MIFCFSGTGNSLFVARRIGQLSGDEVVEVNGLLKSGKCPLCFETGGPLVFVCPTYAWRLPRIFEDFIRNAHFSGGRKAWFVMTCGDETGNAARYIRALCDEKGFEYMGLASVVMPENYVALFEVPDREQALEIIRKAEPVIGAAAEKIKNSQPLPREKVGLIGRVYSTIVNPVFYPFVVHAKGFYTTDACTGCGRCAGLCPLNNIGMVSGKPVWGDTCTHCMACICSCPAKAIEYKKNSQGKPRYLCPLDE
jgi:ferredoxin